MSSHVAPKSSGTFRNTEKSIKIQGNQCLAPQATLALRPAPGPPSRWPGVADFPSPLLGAAGSSSPPPGALLAGGLALLLRVLKIGFKPADLLRFERGLQESIFRRNQHRIDCMQITSVCFLLNFENQRAFEVGLLDFEAKSWFSLEFWKPALILNRPV